MHRRLRVVGYGIGRVFSSLRRRRRRAIGFVLAVAVTLSVIALARLADRNLQAMTRRFGGAQMIVYLEYGTTAPHAERIAEVLRGLGGIERVELVDPEGAMERLRSSLGEHDELLTSLEAGLLPASIEVTLGEGIRDVAAAHPIVEKLASTPRVEEVEFIGEWVEQVTTLFAALRRALELVMLLVAVGGGCVAIVLLANGVRGRNREHRVWELCGATPSFYRVPLLFEASLLGAVAAALALVLTWLLYAWLGAEVAAALSAAFGRITVQFLPVLDMLLLLAAGAALGAVASRLGAHVDAGD